MKDTSLIVGNSISENNISNTNDEVNNSIDDDLSVTQLPSNNEASQALTSMMVSEVFLTAALAFNRLGNLALKLNAPLKEDIKATETNTKWHEEEILMLKRSLSNFGEDLENISRRLNLKTKGLIEADVLRKPENDIDTMVNRSQVAAHATSTYAYQPYQRLPQSLPRRLPLNGHLLSRSASSSSNNYSRSGPATHIPLQLQRETTFLPHHQIRPPRFHHPGNCRVAPTNIPGRLTTVKHSTAYTPYSVVRRPVPVYANFPIKNKISQEPLRRTNAYGSGISPVIREVDTGATAQVTNIKKDSNLQQSIANLNSSAEPITDYEKEDVPNITC